MNYAHALLGLTVVLAAVSVALFLRRSLAILAVMRQSRPDPRWGQLGARLQSVVEHVLFHRRMFRITLSGILHYFIFSGFVVLFIDIVETLGEVIAPGFTVGPVLAAVVDVFVALVLVGVLLALYNRLVVRPERFHGSDEKDAYIILGLIAAIVVGIVIHDSFYPLLAQQVYHRPDPVAPYHFLGAALSQLWQALGWTGPRAAEIGYLVGYLMDIGVVFAFLAYLPYSKHFHIFTAVPNVFLRNLAPAGRMSGAEEGGVRAIRGFQDLRWKDVLDLYACTECGRCQAVCPAHAAGQPLSPKMVILELRDALNAQLAGASKDQPPKLAGEVVRAEELWACTTCGACQEACPVFIEHVPKIVGLRAALLEEGEAEASAQKTLVAFSRQGNSFAQPPRRRGQWAKELGIKDARREPVEWLWFVGDYASYDPRYQPLSRMVAQLLTQAGVDFGILYDGEVNAGNEVLRLGETGLFESLAEKNLAALEKAQYRRIFTTDPHSLNALKHEYARFGLKAEVFHYTEVFLQLVEQGRLALSPLSVRATYHDPCYLGRWNHITEPPRQLIRRMGVELVEMPRHGEQSFCCGAGGGRIWMEETGAGERPANQRIREALALPGVTHFIVACPKDVAMFTASATAMGVDQRLRVVDIAELLAEAAGLPTVSAVGAEV